MWTAEYKFVSIFANESPSACGISLDITLTLVDFPSTVSLIVTSYDFFLPKSPMAQFMLFVISFEFCFVNKSPAHFNPSSVVSVTTLPSPNLHTTRTGIFLWVVTSSLAARSEEHTSELQSHFHLLF